MYGAQPQLSSTPKRSCFKDFLQMPIDGLVTAIYQRESSTTWPVGGTWKLGLKTNDSQKKNGILWPSRERSTCDTAMNLSVPQRISVLTCHKVRTSVYPQKNLQRHSWHLAALTLYSCNSTKVKTLVVHSGNHGSLYRHNGKGNTDSKCVKKKAWNKWELMQPSHLRWLVSCNKLYLCFRV